MEKHSTVRDLEEQHSSQSSCSSNDLLGGVRALLARHDHVALSIVTGLTVIVLGLALLLTEHRIAVLERVVATQEAQR